MNYTDPQAYNRYPQAKLHTQWPDCGKEAPAFDAYMRGRFDCSDEHRHLRTANESRGRCTSRPDRARDSPHAFTGRRIWLADCGREAEPRESDHRRRAGLIAKPPHAGRWYDRALRNNDNTDHLFAGGERGFAHRSCTPSRPTTPMSRHVGCKSSPVRTLRRSRGNRSPLSSVKPRHSRSRRSASLIISRKPAFRTTSFVLKR